MPQKRASRPAPVPAGAHTDQSLDAGQHAPELKRPAFEGRAVGQGAAGFWIDQT